MYLFKRLVFLVFPLLVNFACSNISKPYIQEVEIKNSKIDSIMDYALKEEADYYNKTSICGIMRFSKLNDIFQIEVVITDLNSFDEVERKSFPNYFFNYKEMPVFIINKTIDYKFFKETNAKKIFEYPRIKENSNLVISSSRPPEPPSNFEPTVFFFYYFDGRISFQRKDTFMFEQFAPI